MLCMAALSWYTTPRPLRRENGFTWAPIVEVAVLFAGIFATMMPALAILNARGGELGLTQPWQLFWASGLLSSFLDNAPTYLTFASTASALVGTSAANLSGLIATENGARMLAAVSLGSVLMGAEHLHRKRAQLHGEGHRRAGRRSHAGVLRLHGLQRRRSSCPIFVALTFVFLR